MKEAMSSITYWLAGLVFLVGLVLVIRGRKYIFVPPFIMMLIGLGCNALAIFSNGGFMPVLTTNPAMLEKIAKQCHYIHLTPETRFKFLVDRIDIYQIDATASMGDIVLVVGVVTLVVLGLFYPRHILPAYEQMARWILSKTRRVRR